MEFLRTPDDRFANLPDFPYEPNYLDVNGLRMHYVDVGPRDAAETVLMLHGEPSWSFLYRKMIPVFEREGFRAVAPDLIGFGRSDKPVNRSDYSYLFHMDTLHAFVEKLDLKNITLVCQDWGGLLGIRLACEAPDRFARIAAANTFLPTGDIHPPDAFFQWRTFSQTVTEFPTGTILQRATMTVLTPEVEAAYDAPFPDETYKAGARAFPTLVPVEPTDPATEANRRAWEVLKRWEKPFLTAFSDSDPITRGGDAVFQKLIPGARNVAHTTIIGGGHFLQEDKGEEFAEVVTAFMKKT